MMIAHFLVASLLGAAGPEAAPKPPKADASDAFFDAGPIPEIRLKVEKEALDKLKADPRNYVKATIREGDVDLPGEVGVKLKGAAGSYREWDDRPALTLNMRKFHKGGTYHGLGKFHLNNSAQDDTCLHELICSDLFRKAGIPAPRVTHARVWLNGRDVGLYVLKEGFDRTFLERWFPDASGNLYDGGFVQDLDAALERDEGTGPDDRADLKAIVEAARDPVMASRVRRLEALVDMDEFFAFMALERMTCHWDGYVGMSNNYRVYLDPARGRKAVFLPHGMDQMFSDPGGSLFNESDKLVAAPVIRSDAFRRRYRETLTKLVPLMSPPDALFRRIDEAERRLRPVIAAMDPGRATRHDEQVAEIKRALTARAQSLREQLSHPDEEIQTFGDRGVFALDGWWEGREAGDPVMDQVETGEGKKALRIKVKDGTPCVASWYRRVLLGPGKYTLHAEARMIDVVKPDNEDGGAGIGSAQSGRSRSKVGSDDRVVMTRRFTIEDDRREIMLMLELRAKSGEVQFDSGSLRLVKEPEGGK